MEDLLLDDDLSRILFLVVEVKGWLFGKKVLAGPSLISRVDWETSTVHVDANRPGPQERARVQAGGVDRRE